MRRAALLFGLLGCYPGSDLELPDAEGYLSVVVLGDDGQVFAHAAETAGLALPFTADHDLVLETLLYRRTLAELGMAPGPLPSVDEGRPPPVADSVLRTTIEGGDFSGWDEVDESLLSSAIRIPFFDPTTCAGCLGTDDRQNALCKLDCAPSDPASPAAPQPVRSPIAKPPICSPEEVAWVGELECHPIGPPCPADGWPAEPVDAYVRPGANGDGTMEMPYGSVLDAVRAGAVRIALSTGRHQFEGRMSAPLELIGACSSETIVVSVLRTTAQLVIQDVTIFGGVETSDRLDIRRVHLHGGPMLGETAEITGSELALHDSHIVLADSAMSFERVFISSELPSFTCWGSQITIDGAIMLDRAGTTVSVTSTCSLALSSSVLLPWNHAAVVVEGAELFLHGALVEGPRGIQVRGSAELRDVIVRSSDRTVGATLLVGGHLGGERVEIDGGRRGIAVSGTASISDLAIRSEATALTVDLEGRVELSRALLGARVSCIDADQELVAEDLLLTDCETGISSTGDVSVRRIEIGADVATGAAVFAGVLALTDARLSPRVAGISVSEGSGALRSFLLEGSATGASLSGGSLRLEDGRMEQLGTALLLPRGVRWDHVLRDVRVAGVERLVGDL